MRWRIPLVVAVALFAAVSCDQGPTEFETSAPDAPTLKVVDNYWFSMPFSMDNCREEVIADVRAKWLETYTEAASGNYNYQWKFTVHGKGVGEDTGWDYVWNNSFNWVPHEHGAPGAYPYTESLVDNWVIIGKGKAPNWKAKVTYQFTINANGAVTVDFVKVKESCK